MADKKQTSTTVLAYELDQQSIARAIKGGPDRVEKAITSSLDVLGDYGPITKMNLLAVEQGFKSLDRNIGMHQRTIDDLGTVYADLARQEELLADSDWLNNLRAEADAADDAADSFERLGVAKEGAAGARPSGGGTANPSGLEAVDRLGSSASQILGGVGAGQLGGVAGLIADAANATTMFGPAAAAATLAVGAATAAVGIYTGALEKSTERANTYGEAIKQAFEAGTSAQINALIQQQESDLQVLEATRGALEDKASEARQQLAITLDNASEDLANFLNNLAGTPTDNSQFDLETSLEGYQNELGSVNSEIEIGRVRLEAYRDILGDANIVTNDAEQAAADAADARDERIRLELATAQEAEQLTSEGRRERIQALILEREQLQAAAEMEGISAEYKDELIARTNELNIQMDILSRDMDTAADRAERLAQAQKELEQIESRVTDASDAVLDANMRLVEAHQSALEATNAYNTALFEHEKTLNEIEVNRLAEREKLQAKADDDLLKAQTATAKKIRDIQKKTDASLLNAIANRDVLAYRQAKEAAAEQASAEEESYKEREKELNDSLRKQLADQDKALRQAVDRENQRWEQERATRVRANQQALIDTQNAENAQRMLQQQSNVAALNLMQYRATGEAQLYESMARNAEFWLTYMANRSAAAWSAMATATKSTASLGGGGTTRATPTAFADGGVVTSDGLAMLHAPEVIVPLKAAGKAPLSSVSNITNTAGGITINAMGSTRAQIRAQVYEELESAMTRAGLID